MKTRLYILIFFFIFVVHSLAEKTVWFQGSLSEALQLAKADEKLVLLLFSCGEG